MDILRKMFDKTKNGTEPESKEGYRKDEFRKPAWYEEDETDDELFGRTTKAFQIFTNPIELQKHFEKQMQEMLKSIREMEDKGELFDRDFREEYLKPGYESKIYQDYKKQFADTDLDGEIYPEQLHSLVQTVKPQIKELLPKKNPPPALMSSKDVKKLTDEQKILGRIHGTIIDEEESSRFSASKNRNAMMPKYSPHFGGVFEGTYQGPKMFGQSVVTQTILKPDGTYETKRVVKDSEGNIKTTITRTKEGKSESVTSYGDGKSGKSFDELAQQKSSQYISTWTPERNIFVSKNGYALPMNIW